MSTEPPTPTPTSATTPSPPPLPPKLSSTTTTQNSVGNWKLPNGIEDHIEDGIIKMTVGVLVGGTLGMLLFKSGKGWRSASIASGLGVAMGSTYIRFMSTMNQNNNSNTTLVHSNDVTSTNAAQSLTPGSRLQPFDTKPLPIIGTSSPPSKAS